MSGSPVIVDGFAVGVFVGGPPLPGQRELIKIIQMIASNELLDEAWRMLVFMMGYNIFYRVPLFQDAFSNITIRLHISHCHIVNNKPLPVELSQYSVLQANGIDSIKSLMRLNKPVAIDYLTGFIYRCQQYYTDVDQFAFNSAISTKDNAFMYCVIILTTY